MTAQDPTAGKSATASHFHIYPRDRFRRQGCAYFDDRTSWNRVRRRQAKPTRRSVQCPTSNRFRALVGIGDQNLNRITPAPRRVSSFDGGFGVRKSSICRGSFERRRSQPCTAIAANKNKSSQQEEEACRADPRQNTGHGFVKRRWTESSRAPFDKFETYASRKNQACFFAGTACPGKTIARSGETRLPEAAA